MVKEHLINGHFENKLSVMSNVKKDQCADDVKSGPLWLMIAKCTFYELIKLFLDYDIDVGMTDYNANNFIHILITMVS